MSETLQLILACCICLSGIGVALLLIANLRKAGMSVRAGRLAVLDARMQVSTKKLNAILAAENAQLVAKGIDQGSLFLQAGHRVVSEVTFGLLQLFPSTRGHAQQIKDVHHAISSGIYSTIREINKQVGSNIADSLKNTKPHAKKTVRKRVAAKVRARITRKKK